MGRLMLPSLLMRLMLMAVTFWSCGMSTESGTIDSDDNKADADAGVVAERVELRTTAESRSRTSATNSCDASACEKAQ